MKQKQIQQKQIQKVQKDYGKDLLDTIVFLMLLLGVLYYFQV